MRTRPRSSVRRKRLRSSARRRKSRPPQLRKARMRKARAIKAMARKAMARKARARKAMARKARTMKPQLKKGPRKECLSHPRTLSLRLWPTKWAQLYWEKSVVERRTRRIKRRESERVKKWARTRIQLDSKWQPTTNNQTEKKLII